VKQTEKIVQVDMYIYIYKKHFLVCYNLRRQDWCCRI